MKGVAYMYRRSPVDTAASQQGELGMGRKRADGFLEARLKFVSFAPLRRTAHVLTMRSPCCSFVPTALGGRRWHNFGAGRVAFEDCLSPYLESEFHHYWFILPTPAM